MTGISLGVGRLIWDQEIGEFNSRMPDCPNCTKDDLTGWQQLGKLWSYNLYRRYMFTVEEHLDNLIRHIKLVQDGCVLLGKRIIARGHKGDEEFGINLIAAGFVHDASKFKGVEWKYLHNGSDVPVEKLREAVEQHVETNPHHPEFFGGLDHMHPLAVAEMVVDWYARAQEFGTDLRYWINKEACKKYGFKKTSTHYKLIMEFVDLLLLNPFVKAEE